ncbi:aldo/keto reductase [Rhizophagus irregularis DAOM 181602=DAOM 197198]|uniref:Uncharacterized protein n=1 Tax=Rhizophagus irregularis (strain DAOM 181602 / DAOM 197198 / MUCL 43194) TaxID=747089 RepID=A0A2P4P626_RHIID|nr:hypothetical protein GLOIN_2v1884033 [Rhizophagus irregularis DAOM 181602=DAOM 197198]POG60839.1 hypothetical protein GLOIN_2v1884033 [Rhizophagus irregularis DAOM 181602=DAOM 197198]GBC27600.2 aldo/keto reductase [Rhizophagus irregularis DAOM 181602=DAOM 197198]|eukprot:XP_025167705.1 hypothetical protein GLOIN_2v1884033 [Rhizophagus irregularis DAOM 181602=DAOM 197198]
MVAYVRKACIDLYNQHRVDPETPIENTLGALAELVKESPRTLDIETIGIMETKYLRWIPNNIYLMISDIKNLSLFQPENFAKNLELADNLCEFENLEVVKVQLSSEELSEIRQITISFEIIGERYTATKKLVNV